VKVVDVLIIGVWGLFCLRDRRAKVQDGEAANGAEQAVVGG